MSAKRNKHLNRMMRKTRRCNRERFGSRETGVATSVVTVHRDQLPTPALLDVPDWRSVRHLVWKVPKDTYSETGGDFDADFRCARDLAQSRSMFTEPHISTDTLAGWVVAFTEWMEKRYADDETLMLDRIEAILISHEELLIQRINQLATKAEPEGFSLAVPSHQGPRGSRMFLARPDHLALRA